MTNEKFDQWCIVELFGHQRIAGRVSEQVIGGQSFVRVDVPPTPSASSYTRLFGSGAIYAINPVTEEIACAAARGIRAQPIGVFDLPADVQEAMRAARDKRDALTVRPEFGEEEAEEADDR